MSLVRHTVFWGSTSVLFDSEVVNYPDLEEDLKVFDETFELAVSPLPQFLVPGFQKAKAALHRQLPAIMQRRAKRDRLDYKDTAVDDGGENSYVSGFVVAALIW